MTLPLELPILSTHSPAMEPLLPLESLGPADWYRFSADRREYLFVVDASQVYEIDGPEFDRLASDMGPEVLSAWGIPLPGAVSDIPPTSVPMRSLSLAVAQSCNLGCTYCYAEGGNFGGDAKSMSLQTAIASLDRLIENCPPGERVNVAFLGGEPLIARNVLRAATEYAVQRAKQLGVRIGFSVTTNGTLLNEEDGDFFEQHSFAVTLSLDGLREHHDRQRAFLGGGGSFDRILSRVNPLLARQRHMQISARVTVTPRNLDLPTVLDSLISLGFHSVGFSPMLSSPTGQDQMHAAGLEQMLDQMVMCGHKFEKKVIAGERYPFSNLVCALAEIHKGTHRPYPCGAGGGYFGVSADGELAACHRFVGDADAAMGTVASGVDAVRQAEWLSTRHVHFQQPCKQCWARYLCGGGCHHEVLRRGRPACDYIRGWLSYSLSAYSRLLAASPDYFHAGVAN